MSQIYKLKELDSMFENTFFKSSKPFYSFNDISFDQGVKSFSAFANSVKKEGFFIFKTLSFNYKDISYKIHEDKNNSKNLVLSLIFTKQKNDNLDLKNKKIIINGIVNKTKKELNLLNTDICFSKINKSKCFIDISFDKKSNFSLDHDFFYFKNCFFKNYEEEKHHKPFQFLSRQRTEEYKNEQDLFYLYKTITNLNIKTDDFFNKINTRIIKNIIEDTVKNNWVIDSNFKNYLELKYTN